MTDQSHIRPDTLHRDSLAFFGAVAASISHELNNVISILDQSAGLVADLVAGAQAGRPLPPEKLAQVADSMQRQTQRGLEIIRRMNKFAHSSDIGVGGCDINETVLNFGNLCRRWADMKRVTLSVTPAPQPVGANIDPFLLQFWLYVLIKHFLAGAVPGTELRMTVDRDDHVARVSIAGAGGVAFDEANPPDPEPLVRAALGATVRCDRAPNTTTVRLILGGE